MSSVEPIAGDILSFPVMRPNTPQCKVVWRANDGRQHSTVFVPVMGHMNLERSKVIAIFVDLRMYDPAYAHIKGVWPDSWSIYKQKGFELRSSRSHAGHPIPSSEHFRVVLSQDVPVYACTFSGSQRSLTFLIIRPKHHALMNPIAIAKDINMPNEFWDTKSTIYDPDPSKEALRSLREARFLAFGLWSGTDAGAETGGDTNVGFGGGAGGGDA